MSSISPFKLGLPKKVTSHLPNAISPQFHNLCHMSRGVEVQKQKDKIAFFDCDNHVSETPPKIIHVQKQISK